MAWLPYRAVVPIGACYAGTLWLGNAAYLYLSVSFIQMLKVMLTAADPSPASSCRRVLPPVVALLDCPGKQMLQGLVSATLLPARKHQQLQHGEATKLQHEHHFGHRLPRRGLPLRVTQA